MRPSALQALRVPHRIGEPLTVRRVVVVRKASAIDLLESRPDAKLQHALGVRDPLAERVLQAHLENQASAEAVEAELRGRQLSFKVVPKLTPPLARWADLVVSVGGDGTFLRASHAVRPWGEGVGAPMLGVNSASSSAGFFCSACSRDFGEQLDLIASGAMVSRALWRMEILVNGVPLDHHALNDILFAHRVPAETSRYVITVDGVSQEQKSSGIWISTAAGSTGAMRSAGGVVQPMDSRELQFLVREPMDWALKGTPLVHGCTLGEVNTVSRMVQGALYIDGGNLRVAFGFGDRLTFRTADKPLAWFAPPELDARRRALTTPPNLRASQSANS